MTQKIIRVGDSAATVIPKSVLQELGLNIGDKITLEVNADKKQVIVKPLAVVDKELESWTKKFISRYRPALEELAKK